MKPKKRPLEITLFVWFHLLFLAMILLAYLLLILDGLLTLKDIPGLIESTHALYISLTQNALIKFPVIFLYVYNSIGGIAVITAFVGILKARNWARVTFIILSGSGILVNLLVFGFKILPLSAAHLVIFLIYILILFNPRATNYFSTTKA